MPKILARFSLFSLLLYSTVGSLLIVVGAAREISFRDETTGCESVNPFIGILAARTGHLYHVLSAPPYTPQPFGPLYYFASAVIARVSHLDIDSTFRLGRTANFACFLLCSVLVWAISRKTGFSQGESTLAGMMSLAQPAFLTWAATMRPDAPALLAMLLALYFAVSSKNDPSRTSTLSGVLVGIGFLLKQSAAPVGFAIPAVYLANRRYKQILVFVLGGALPVAAALALLRWHEEPFLAQFLLVGRASWWLIDGVTWVVHTLPRPTVFVSFAVGAVGFLRAISDGESGPMIASFTLVNLLAAFAAIPQRLGNVNYFFPALAGCALLLPFAIRAFLESSQAIKTTGILATLAFLAAFADCAVSYYWVLPNGAGRQIPTGSLSSFKILSDGPYIALHGRDPVLLDPLTAHSLELRNRWDPSGIVRSIQTGEYDLAILTQGHTVPSYRGISRLGPKIVRSLNENYKILCTAGGKLILVPRSREVRASPDMLSRVFGSCAIPPPDVGPGISLGYPAE